MNIPLYSAAGENRNSLSWAPTVHSGLWWDKFFSGWKDRSFSEIRAPAQDAGGKRQFIDTLAGKTVGDHTMLQSFAMRRQKLIAALSGATVATELKSSFVTGMGYEHPVENGFLWHAVLGVPYLPGSSIKGMLRAWARYYADTDGQNDFLAEVDRLFGDPGCAGELILFDAIPIEPVALICEIVTPHDDGWRVKPAGQTFPSDWISPVPIPFLAVAPGAKFDFAIASRRRDGGADVAKAEGWLSEALDWLGVGAKTNIGFGRFQTAEAKAEEAQSRPLAAGDRVQIADSEPQQKLRGRKGVIEAVYETRESAKLSLDGGGKGSQPIVLLAHLERAAE